jgi:lysophospholipase L1-like esterase
MNQDPRTWRRMKMGLAALMLAAVAAAAVAAAAGPARAEEKPTPSSGAAGEFFLHNGDSPIVFLGDSITEQRLYTTYIEAYVLTRFPGWNVTFRNIGWGGDTAGLRKRDGFEPGLKRDVLPLKAKAILIDFGMNDARAGDKGLEEYVQFQTRLVHDLKAAGARVALITSSPEERFEADQPAGSAYNKMLAKYSAALAEVARKEQVPFVDQLNPFIKVIEDGRKAGVLAAEGNPRLIPDGVHPNPAGHLVMAGTILKGLGAPALVSRLEIDGAARKVTAAEKCKAEILPDAKEGELQFSRSDEGLPWPVSKEAEMVLTVPGFTVLADLSRYELKVTGLTAARYDLEIDGQKAATLTKEELEAGANLTVRAGAITEQGRKLLAAIAAKNNLYFDRWRKVVVPAMPPSLSEADLPEAAKARAAELDKMIADSEKEIEGLRAAKTHTFRLLPAP